MSANYYYILGLWRQNLNEYKQTDKHALNKLKTKRKLKTKKVKKKIGKGRWRKRWRSGRRWWCFRLRKSSSLSSWTSNAQNDPPRTNACRRPRWASSTDTAPEVDIRQAQVVTPSTQQERATSDDDGAGVEAEAEVDGRRGVTTLPSNTAPMKQSQL